MSDIDLKSLVLPEKTVTLEYYPDHFPGFQVDLCHISRTELQKLVASATRTKFDRTKGPVESIDQEAFTKALLEKTVKGWSGLKCQYLGELLLVDPESFDDPDAEVPFTKDNLKTLISECDQFDQWVSDETSNLENFTKSK